MHLKTAATFLMTGSVAVAAHQLVVLYSVIFLGVHVYTGLVQAGITGLILTSHAVISFLFALSYRRTERHTTGRTVLAILPAVFSGILVIVKLFNGIQLLEWVKTLPGTFIIAQALFSIFGLFFVISLLLPGISLAGTRQKRQRRSYYRVMICSGVAAVYSIGFSIYHFELSLFTSSLAPLVLSGLATVLFPTSFMLLSLALLRRRHSGLFEEQEDAW